MVLPSQIWMQVGQSRQVRLARPAVQLVENIPFIQFISRRLKWLWLGMIKGLNWIKIQQVFIGTNRYQDRYSRDISPLDGA